MIKLTPPMGWNSWNTFGENINEKMIFETADVMAESGLRDKGYEYLVIDDCWSLRERDENGRLVPDPEKFPHGMKAVADYVHSKGLKFGMYSCAGNMTCAGYPGSYEHEFVDAETFASWDVDFLKYDYCYHSPILHGKYLYRRMGLALENCGRDILFSACSWGADEINARAYFAAACDDVLGQFYTFGGKRVHLPVAGNNFLSHIRFVFISKINFPSGNYSSHHFLTSSIEGAFRPSLFFLLKPHKSLKNLPGASFFSASTVM